MELAAELRTLAADNVKPGAATRVTAPARHKEVSPYARQNLSHRRFLVTPGAAADRYLDELGRGGKAATTRNRYRTYLYLLADMYPYVDVEDLTAEMWRKWVDRICKRVDGGDLDVDTISQRMGIAKSFSRWLLDEQLIPDDALKRMTVPRRKDPIENDSILWVSTEQAQRMLAVAARDLNLYTDPADRFRKILCLGVLAYTGSRRAAVANARIGDVENLLGDKPTITFHEKGGKRITKPLNSNLAGLIREASLAGVWNEPKDYLVPPRSTTWADRRDGKVIWRLVKEVAHDAGVKAHVHALRAAFAVIFLESKPDHLWQLQQLLGHSSQETTRLYLRRANRQKGMETVLDLDWGVPLTGTTFEGNPVTEKEGFEPSFSPNTTEKTE
jgi:integrase